MKTLCERILSSDAILSFKRKIKIGDLLAMKKMQQQNFPKLFLDLRVFIFCLLPTS